MSKMKQLVKLEGFGNIKMMDADIPVPDQDGILAKVHRSLISRGSELFKRCLNNSFPHLILNPFLIVKNSSFVRIPSFLIKALINL